MANTKISALTEDTAPTFDDLAVTVNDPTGTPATKKAKLLNVTGAPVNAQTGTTYTVLTSDFRKLVTHTNASPIAVTLPQASATFPAGWYYFAQNRGAGAVTITPTTSTIDGASTLVLNQFEGALIVSDGTNYFTMRGKTIVGAGGGAPADATYITQTANGSLSAEQALSSLSTGLMCVATTTGVITSITDSAGLAANISDETGSGALVFATSPTLVTPALGTPASGVLTNCTIKCVIAVAVSDETTAITTGTAKVTFRMPHAMTLTEVRASLSTASSSGNPAIDVNEGGVSIFSTTLTIDSGEKTSTTAATPAVISDSALADDAEITIDIDTAGTGAKGLKVYLIGTRT